METFNVTSDLDILIEQARFAYSNAYAPYSGFNVGASLKAEGGGIFNGCNVENASYGLTVCAERNCISHAVSQGNTKFSILVVYTEQVELTPPCGACRQVIAEFMPQDATVVSANHLGEQKQWTVKQLLPDAFLPIDLNKE